MAEAVLVATKVSAKCRVWPAEATLIDSRCRPKWRAVAIVFAGKRDLAGMLYAGKPVSLCSGASWRFNACTRAVWKDRGPRQQEHVDGVLADGLAASPCRNIHLAALTSGVDGRTSRIAAIAGQQVSVHGTTARWQGQSPELIFSDKAQHVVHCTG